MTDYYLGSNLCCSLMGNKRIPTDGNNVPSWCPLQDVKQLPIWEEVEEEFEKWVDSHELGECPGRTESARWVFEYVIKKILLIKHIKDLGSIEFNDDYDAIDVD